MITATFLPYEVLPNQNRQWTISLSDLKTRFRAKSEKIRSSPANRVSTTSSRSRKPGTLSNCPLSPFLNSCLLYLLKFFRLSGRSCPSLTRRCSAKGPDAGNGRFSRRSAILTEAVEWPGALIMR
jgi:hypothetical protein